jgi:hypothetical protein
LKKYLIIIGWILHSGIFTAQVTDLHIQENLNGLIFKEFVERVESNHPVHFFYNPDWADSIIVEYPSELTSLTEILGQVLKGKNIYPLIDPDGNIILTKDMPVRANLPSGFFEMPDQLYKNKSNEPFMEETFANNTSSEETNDENLVINIGQASQRNSSGVAIISGYIRDIETGEPIIGAVVYVEDLEIGVVSDLDGYYVLSIPEGRHVLSIHFLGKKEIHQHVYLYSDGNMNIEMSEKITQLRGVEIIADRDKNVAGLQIGLAKMDVKSIKELPAVMGEVDIIKAALLLPGVQTVGEGASGFNVRGGSTDQNLILINNAPVFNSSHLFGFFSVFNPDVISEMKLYKSGIPASYGGRISSVFDIVTKTGNKKKFSGTGGISPVTGRLTIEGPVIREKASFIIGGRTTYSDWILNRLKSPSLRNSDASFYDMNARFNYDINKNNSLDISGYISHDFFRLNSDTTYNYTNRNAAISFKHLFSEKLIASFSGLYTWYDYRIGSHQKPVYAYEMTYGIRDIELKSDFTWFPRYDHKVNFGTSSIWYLLNPGNFYGTGEESIMAPLKLEDERGMEHSVYISDEYTVNQRISLYGGIRFSSFFYMGPKTVYSYYKNMPKETYNISDTTSYGKGVLIQPYLGPEFRFSARYKTGTNSSVKISYNRMRQYLHMLSNTTAISPTDTWKLSDSHIRPQVGDQIALGVYYDFYKNSIETSAEIYYKHIKDIIEYKGGSELLLNNTIETDLINGTGKAYGLEMMIRKKSGRLNGWIGYTYSRTWIQVTGDYPEEKINNGDYFPANYDKPHDLTMVGNYKFSRRFSVSSTFTYSTGRPITYPVAKYKYRNKLLLHYSYRNEYRIPDYLRWDLSVNLEGNLKSHKLANSSWSLSAYNVTGRNNVYSIYFISGERKVSGYKLSVFSQPIITLTYNFKF